MAKLVALIWVTSKASVPVAEEVAVNQISPEPGYAPQGGGVTPDVPVAPDVVAFKVVQAGPSAGKAKAAAGAGQLDIFGLQEAAGRTEHGLSPGGGQPELAQSIVTNAERAALFTQVTPDASNRRMK